MQSSKQCCIQEIGINPGCNPDITTSKFGSKWVGSFILPATIPVITIFCNYLFTKIPLFLIFKGLVEKTIIHFRFFTDCLNQFDLFGTQFREDFLDLSCFHTWFKIIQQRIVYMLIRLKEFGILTPHIHDFFQMRLKVREVIVLSSFFPGAVSDNCDPGKFSYKITGNFGLFAVIP